MFGSEGPYAACSVDHPRPDCALVHITGELDAGSAPRVDSEIASLVSPECRTVILDMGDVEFIDSTGIQLVIQMLHRRRGTSQVVVVSPKARSPRRALEIVGLNRVVKMVDSVEEALTVRAAPTSAPPEAGQRPSA